VTRLTVGAALARLGVTRLAHFAPTLNLVPTLRDGRLRSSKDLAEHAADYFYPTDLERLDHHEEHICCSFEYPNVYYLRKARQKPPYRNYPDWLCFLINPDVADRPNTLVSSCNAAKAHGAHLRPGGQAVLDAWLSPSPAGYTRSARQHPAVPTDLQAEILVPGPIMLSSVTAIVVRSDELARELYGLCNRWTLAPDRFGWKVAPAFFDVNLLVPALRNGRPVAESTWDPTNDTR
jgi:hypothetical protein